MSFFKERSEECLQQCKDYQKRIFIMFPTVFCINFSRAFSFLTQVQEQMRLGRLLMSL